MTTRENRPGGYSEAASKSATTDRNLTRRRAASQRLPALDCGRSDAWYYEPPTAGYELAAAHLLEHGLTPAPDVDGLRAMWRRGGCHRRAAGLIAQRWEMAS
jgi:hypothetical protein